MTALRSSLPPGRCRAVATTPDRPWQPLAACTRRPELTLDVTAEEFQSWDGFGGCFNEMGWEVIQGLPGRERTRLFRDLFSPEDGCRFTLGRLPIGASDYALEWYSHNETPGDYAMRHFSIERDRKYLLPYLRAARAVQPELRLFASPWSPPTWMKSPRVYNYGTLVWDRPTLDAYALYFVRFVQAYAAEGLPIAQVHVQNEPLADQKFPSCLWTGAQLRDFIRDHLGPAFRKHKIASEIWLGTLNTDNFRDYPQALFNDPRAAAFTAGIGLQWAGKGMVQRLNHALPGVPLMQTENECGNGDNSWEYARYIFNLMWHYITNGVRAYVYWNMVLPPGGRSTWGWKQNAMITVDPATHRFHYNPEFYVMKHYAAFIEPGARRLGVHGPLAADAVAFRNPGGETVVVLQNPSNAAPCRVALRAGAGKALTLELPPGAFASARLG